MSRNYGKSSQSITISETSLAQKSENSFNNYKNLAKYVESGIRESCQKADLFLYLFKIIILFF